MITPRETFQKSEHAKRWLDVVDSQQFHMAAQAAFAQMQLDLSLPRDMNQAAIYQCELQGAKHFLSLLMQLTNPEKTVPTTTGRNLNHHV